MYCCIHVLVDLCKLHLCKSGDLLWYLVTYNNVGWLVTCLLLLLIIYDFMFSDEVLYHDTKNAENVMQSSILRDGPAAGVAQSQLAVLDNSTDADDYTVEIKIDVDSYVEDSSTIKGCHKICRLCAHLVYEYKLISIFPPDKTKCLASKINRLLPEKVCNMGEFI